jgi:arylsulfatase A-like enzyme
MDHEQKARMPNIVYILADDLGYGDVQCLNPERGKIATPHLDRLAEQGMRFTDAHSGSSVCTPTRYGILTGRYAWRTRLQSGVFSDYVQPLIAKDRLTVPALLKQHGYHTACIGKWHLGFTIAERGNDSGEEGPRSGAPLGSVTNNGPTTRGFDHYFGFHHARMMKSVFEQDRVTQIVEPIDLLGRIAEESAGYIQARSQQPQPFFLYVALSAPHSPVVPSADWQGKSELGAYGDFVMETDAAVGRILQSLETAGQLENTLVIVTSDNGCAWDAAGVSKLERQGHFPSANLRGYKTDIWDGGHRVPFFVRWPGKVSAGSSSDQLICLTDLMGTVADLVDAELPDTAAEDSVSILPALLGNASQPLREAVVHHSIRGKFAIRQGDWKLCFCAGSGGSSKSADKAPLQLYDMARDQGETTNLAGDHPEVVAKLTALMEQYIAEGRSTPGERQENDVPVQFEKP